MNTLSNRLMAPILGKLKMGTGLSASENSACIATLRCILVAGALAGILLSIPLWTVDRLFPLLPAGLWMPSIPAPWDKWFLGVWLTSLVLSPCFPRAGVITFLSGAVLLCLSDQNRLQPWFYLYSVMLFFTLFSKATALAGARVAISGVYLWSGVMKLTPVFFHDIAPWFVEPFVGSLPQLLGQSLQFGARLTPFIEILIGIGLWLPRCRGWAIWASVVIHGGALICLGPLGRNYNLVVWPWNVAMPILAWVLFHGQSNGFVSNWKSLRRSFAAAVVAILFFVMPAFSWMGWWDSYLSFSVYSSNGTVAAIHVSKAFRDQLPEDIQRFARPLQTRPCLSRLEGTYLLDHLAWALSVLGTPSLPEARNYRSIVHYLMGHHPGRATDVSMLIKTSRGSILYYEGERCRGMVRPEPAPVERASSNETKK